MCTKINMVCSKIISREKYINTWFKDNDDNIKF